MKMILLSNTGKCGTLFIQRLFDGHPFLVTLPFAFNFYFAWNKLKTEEDDLDSFVARLLDETSLNEVLKYVSRDLYIKRIKDHLPNDFCIKKDRKELLEAIHLAYSFLIYRNKKTTHLLVNSINVNYLDQIKSDYPDHKHIFLIRDPKNSYASYVSADRDNDPEKKYQFVKNILHNVLYSQIYESNYPGQIRYLKIEELNEDLPGKMKELCKWLNLNYSDSLVQETVNSNQFANQDAYENKRNVSAKIRNTRWVHTLSMTEVALLEFLNEELIRDHYGFISSKFLRNKRMAKFLLFMPNVRHFFTENKDMHEMLEYLVHYKWLTSRLNWLKLIKAVENKKYLNLY